MASKKINIPFLNNRTIKRKADSFREKLWDDNVPVDIENIIDLRLKMDVIPVVKLQERCDTDALIFSNWKSIYVDKDRALPEQIKIFFCPRDRAFCFAQRSILHSKRGDC